MKKVIFPVLLGMAVFAGSVQAKTIAGRVVSVADGDTLTILINNERQRIRLAEIDAPESKQPFGQRSKQALLRMCGGKNAVVAVDSTDRYGRTIGRVTCDGVDTTAQLVREGMAWVYTNYSKDKNLLVLQEQARKSKTGLWSDPHALEPWLWRRGERPGGVTVSTKPTPKPSQVAAKGVVRGNLNSKVYHLPHCGSYNAINPKNIQAFESEEAAKKAGYRKAGNCG